MDSITKRCPHCKVVKPVDEFHKGHYWCKECRRIEKQEYIKENHEKILEQHRAYNHLHKGEIKDKNRIYSNVNREKINARARLVRQTPLGKVKSERNRKEYRAKYPEKNLEINRRYRNEHPEKYREYRRNRDAKIRGGNGKFTNEEWEEILERYGRKCLCCGTTEKITRDHVIPVSLGGANTKENIQPLCQSCNSKKKKKVIDYREDLQV